MIVIIIWDKTIIFPNFVVLVRLHRWSLGCSFIIQFTEVLVMEILGSQDLVKYWSGWQAQRGSWAGNLQCHNSFPMEQSFTAISEEFALALKNYTGFKKNFSPVHDKFPPLFDKFSPYLFLEKFNSLLWKTDPQYQFYKPFPNHLDRHPLQ